MKDTSTACVVTILCIFAISSTQGLCRHDKETQNTGVSGQMKGSHHLHCCGNQSYIISESACCNGNLTRGISKLVSYCCGSVAYDPLNEICCDGTIFTRSSAHTKCCNKVMYQTTTHICCNGKRHNRTEIQNNCCGKEPFDTTTHCCCLNNMEVKPKNDPCCQNQKEFKCGSAPFNPETQICCSGTLYKKSTEHTKCCGTVIYSLTEDVLCCNGKFHREVPKHSECVGGIVYTPVNTTCQLPARPRLGEHCCGGQTYNPRTQICCNGHRHNKKNNHFCCGSQVYDYHNQSQRCCSGHLYNLSYSSEKAECCGNLLIEHNKQTCCSSSIHSIKYDTKSGHRCCGHHYYNTSLWSCCAENLKPILNHKIVTAEYRLKPLMDLIPGICNKTVLLGKVESIALDISQRHIVLQVVAQLNWKSEQVIKDPWLFTYLDHCSSPALENGMTYLWEENPDNPAYKPLSHPVNLTSDIHMLYTVCYQHKGHKGG